MGWRLLDEITSFLAFLVFYNNLKYDKKAISTFVHLYKFFSHLYTIPYVSVNFTYLIGSLGCCSLSGI
jgi:hypothetical protein